MVTRSDKVLGWEVGSEEKLAFVETEIVFSEEDTHFWFCGKGNFWVCLGAEEALWPSWAAWCTWVMGMGEDTSRLIHFHPSASLDVWISLPQNESQVRVLGGPSPPLHQGHFLGRKFANQHQGLRGEVCSVESKLGNPPGAGHAKIGKQKVFLIYLYCGIKDLKIALSRYN